MLRKLRPMDPLSLSSAAVGVVSLAIDVFDRSVKRKESTTQAQRQIAHWSSVFRFFSSMVDMPRDFEQCRVQLMIEYNRLLSWGDAVGLIEEHDAKKLCSLVGNEQAMSASSRV